MTIKDDIRLSQYMGRFGFLLKNLFDSKWDQPHYVKEYVRLTRRLRADHPYDEAMSLAVGGDYASMGAKLADIVEGIGLKNGDCLLDFASGSGRLAAAISQRVSINYTGIDVVHNLLSYARSKSPPHYKFVLSRGLNLPTPDSWANIFCAFSIFTHLKHEESFYYLKEAFRVLKPGGLLVLSMLEFADEGAWLVFEETVAGLVAGRKNQANVYIERNALNVWASRIGFSNVKYLSESTLPPVSGLGQTVAVLTK